MNEIGCRPGLRTPHAPPNSTVCWERQHIPLPSRYLRNIVNLVDVSGHPVIFSGSASVGREQVKKSDDATSRRVGATALQVFSDRLEPRRQPLNTNAPSVQQMMMTSVSCVRYL